MTQSAEIIYNRYIDLANQNHECPLCERQFNQEAQLKEFIQKLKEVLSTVPASNANNQKQLQDLELLSEQLKKLQPDYDAVKRIKGKELPDITTKIEENTKTLNKHSSSIDKLSNQLETLNAEDSKLVNLINETDIIGRYYKESLQLISDIKKEETKLFEISQDSRTIEEVTKDYETLRKTSASLNTKLDDLRSESQKQTEELNKKEAELVKLKEEFLQMNNLAVEIDKYIVFLKKCIYFI